MLRHHTFPRSTLIRAVIITLVASLSCSDDPSAPEEPGASNLSLESSNRETATIGASGGSVSTTSNAGVTYTLAIPPWAIPGEVEIAITPVTAITNLPVDGRLEGAVRLEPSGLTLLVPAMLTIGVSPTTTGAEQLIGFAYEGNADSFEAAAAIDGITEIRVPVRHFSGAGAASSEGPLDLADVLCADAPTFTFSFTGQMTHCQPATEDDREWFFRFARDYLEDVVTPLVQVDGDLETGIRAYNEWLEGCEQLAELYGATDWRDVLANDIAAVTDLIKDELVASVAGEKSALCSQGDTEHLWQLIRYWYFANSAEFEDTAGLRWEDIADGLCAEIRIPELTLADPLPMNQGTSLDARAELWINDHRQDAVFEFAVSHSTSNATCANGRDVCSGYSNGLGEYTVVVTRNAPGLVDITVSASLVVEVLNDGWGLAHTPLLASERIVRESASIAVTYPAVVEPGVATALTAVVTWDNPGGTPRPIEGAVVTFTVDGGTANPVGDVTDASGVAQTQVAANDGPNRIVVDIAAATNGVVVATKSVEAAIDDTPPPASIQLLSRRSFLQGVEITEACSGVGDPSKLVEDAGDLTIDVFGNETCVDSLGDGMTVATRYRSVDTELRSDTGLQTGVIAIESDGTLTAEINCTGDAGRCESEFAGAQTFGEVWIEFRVLEPVNFEFDGTHLGANGQQFLPQFTVTRIDGGLTDEKMNWSGQAPNSWDGTLEPGDYRVLYRFQDEVRAFPDPVLGGRQDFWWDTGLTLQLTRAPAPANAGSR